jgi:hypothetical protein
MTAPFLPTPDRYGRYPYRGYTVCRDPKPIGTRAFDWEFWPTGSDETDSRAGFAGSFAGATEMIDELIREEKP